jgi:hypothetical protein
MKFNESILALYTQKLEERALTETKLHHILKEERQKAPTER